MGLADADGLGTLNFQWLRDGAAIADATGQTYTAGRDDVGKPLSVRVSFTDNGGTAESLTSEVTAIVEGVNSPALGSVTISGNPTQGEHHPRCYRHLRGNQFRERQHTELQHHWRNGSGT
ncbi:MAG: hypothetical protein ACI87W_001439 [Halieaceae bacterium]